MADNMERRILNLERAAGNKSPSFNVLRSREMILDYGPGGFAGLRTTVAQSISDNTQTALVWSTVAGTTYFRGPEPVSWTSASGATSEVRVIGRPIKQAYLVFGHVTWAANTSGTRNIVLEQHYGGSSVSATTINESGPTTAGTRTQPFVTAWIPSLSAATSEAPTFITLDVLQNSGGALNVIEAAINIFKLW
jgi:hypothetical protein